MCIEEVFLSAYTRIATKVYQKLYYSYINGKMFIGLDILRMLMQVRKRVCFVGYVASLVSTTIDIVAVSACGAGIAFGCGARVVEFVIMRIVITAVVVIVVVLFML